MEQRGSVASTRAVRIAAAARLAGTCVLALTVLLAGVVASAQPAPGNPGSGQAPDQWTAQWWQFVISFPAPGNPLLDDGTAGDTCAIAQRGPVWMLGATVLPAPVTRHCTVPEGKALLFPVANIVDVNVAAQSASELRAEIDPIIDGAINMAVEIDGSPLAGFQQQRQAYRVRSPAFEITLPPDNLFGLPAGTYSPAVADGYYVTLDHLTVGHHTIHIHGELPLGGYVADVTYQLDVVPIRLK
jgi:hypothetical protein